MINHTCHCPAEQMLWDYNCPSIHGGICPSPAPPEPESVIAQKSFQRSTRALYTINNHNFEITDATYLFYITCSNGNFNQIYKIMTNQEVIGGVHWSTDGTELFYYTGALPWTKVDFPLVES